MDIRYDLDGERWRFPEKYSAIVIGDRNHAICRSVCLEFAALHAVGFAAVAPGAGEPGFGEQAVEVHINRIDDLHGPRLHQTGVGEIEPSCEIELEQHDVEFGIAHDTPRMRVE